MMLWVSAMLQQAYDEYGNDDRHKLDYCGTEFDYDNEYRDDRQEAPHIVNGKNNYMYDYYRRLKPYV